MPDLGTVLSSWWGPGYQSSGLAAIVGDASNIIVGGNPEYCLNDFAAIYPNFLGPGSAFQATLTDQSPVLQNVTATGVGNYGVNVIGPGGSGTVPLESTGVQVGQFVTGPGIQCDSYILSFGDAGWNYGGYGGGGYGGDGNSILLTNPVSLAGLAQAVGWNQGGYNEGGYGGTGQINLAPVTVYQQPFVPIPVLNVYLRLALCCIFKNRYGCAWNLAVSLFIAHFATLFLQSSGQPASSAAQVAAQGLQTGILTSKSVGGVSAGYTNNVPADWMNMYGQFTSTAYGYQLATLANAVAPHFVWIY
jgi:hypothetical protein